MAFRHGVERYQLAEEIFKTMEQYLRGKGLLLREGTVVDSTIIHAPTSTENEKREREPEMHQTCKGNQWFFGMKGHLGVDKDSSLIYSVATTAAHVSDWQQRYSMEKRAWFMGMHSEARVDDREQEVDCRIAMRPGKRRR